MPAIQLEHSKGRANNGKPKPNKARRKRPRATRRRGAGTRRSDGVTAPVSGEGRAAAPSVGVGRDWRSGTSTRRAGVVDDCAGAGRCRRRGADLCARRAEGHDLECV